MRGRRAVAAACLTLPLLIGCQSTSATAEADSVLRELAAGAQPVFDGEGLADARRKLYPTAEALRKALRAYDEHCHRHGIRGTLALSELVADERGTIIARDGDYFAIELDALPQHYLRGVRFAVANDLEGYKGEFLCIGQRGRLVFGRIVLRAPETSEPRVGDIAMTKTH